MGKTWFCIIVFKKLDDIYVYNFCHNLMWVTAIKQLTVNFSLQILIILEKEKNQN